MTMYVPVRPTPALQCTQGTPGVRATSCKEKSRWSLNLLCTESVTAGPANVLTYTAN